MTPFVNASIFTNDDVRAKVVSIHCSFLQISLRHFCYVATTAYDRDSTLTKDTVRWKWVPAH